jgi:hypothetical protein
MTVVTSESNMGKGQVPKRVKHSILPLVFSVAVNDIHCFGRVPMSVGIVDRNGGYAS